MEQILKLLSEMNFNRSIAIIAVVGFGGLRYVRPLSI